MYCNMHAVQKVSSKCLTRVRSIFKIWIHFRHFYYSETATARKTSYVGLMSSPHVADANCGCITCTACIGYACIRKLVCIAYTRLGLSGVSRPSCTIMHARDRERARLAAANFVHRSSVTSAWGLRAVCFCMREGASVAPKCQNEKYKPPW